MPDVSATAVSSAGERRWLILGVIGLAQLMACDEDGCRILNESLSGSA